MTFLDLCKAASLDSGLISSQNLMTTTLNQSGRQLKVVNAVADAWDTIQTGRTDWAWLKAQFSHALVIGQSSYTPAQLGITSRFRAFLRETDEFRPHTIYDPAIGLADESELCEVRPAQWRTTYDRGVQTNSRPIHFAREAGNLLLGPLPSKTYTLRGWYKKSPQRLAADADVPECPDYFHVAIKWRAILDLHGKDGAFADRAVAQAEYSRLYRLLVNEQTDPVVMGGALC